MTLLYSPLRLHFSPAAVSETLVARSSLSTLHLSAFPLVARCPRRFSGTTSQRSGRVGSPSSPPYLVKAEVQPGGSIGVDSLTQVKHLLLPITDRNPYLSEGTRQAAATTTALAKKYGADITVVVIDDKSKETLPEHETQLSTIRWHLSEGGFQEFGLLERLGEGKKPTAIIGEVADDLNLDLVVLCMEAIHSKLVDGNLLAEFVPCPVLLLPLAKLGSKKCSG